MYARSTTFRSDPSALDDGIAYTGDKGQAQAIREQFTDHVGLHVTEVAEFDLVLAHLRVPEKV
jgi:hypothetical protein